MYTEPRDYLGFFYSQKKIEKLIFLSFFEVLNCVYSRNIFYSVRIL